MSWLRHAGHNRLAVAATVLSLGCGGENDGPTGTIVTPPAGATDVVYRFCNPANYPVFFAYQDGTGGWQPVTTIVNLPNERQLSFKLKEARGGVLAVYRTEPSDGENSLISNRSAGMRGMATAQSRRRRNVLARVTSAAARTQNHSFLADNYLTEILYASTAEHVQGGLDNCAQTPIRKTVTATVTGVPPGAFGIVSFGYSTEVFTGGASTNPVTFTVPVGSQDLVGSRMAVPGTPPNTIVVIRNQDIPFGGSLPAPVDFNGPAAFAPATASVSITGAAGDELETFVDLVTATSEVGMWFELARSPATTRPWAGLNPAAMMSGDLHALIVFGNPQNISAEFRVTGRYVGPVSNQSVALGPRMNATATSQVAAGTYPRLRFQGTVPAEYNKGVSIEVLSSNDSGNALSMLATSTYLAAAGNPLMYDFTMPDVSRLGGFPAGARLTAGSNDVAASGFGFTGAGFFDPRPTLGSEFRAASKSARINVQ